MTQQPTPRAEAMQSQKCPDCGAARRGNIRWCHACNYDFGPPLPTPPDAQVLRASGRRRRPATLALILWTPLCWVLAVLLESAASGSCSQLSEPELSQCMEGVGFAVMPAIGLWFTGLPVLAVVWFTVWWPNRDRQPTSAAELPSHPPLSGWTCLNPTPIPTPSGRPEHRRYFSTGRPFEPHQIEVSLDGQPLRRGLDYDVGGDAGWIGIHPTVEVSGDQELYACFLPQPSWVVKADGDPAPR